MNIMKKNLFFAMLCLIGCSHAVLKADMCCWDNIHVGVDFLYWDYCTPDTDYAIEADEPFGAPDNDFKTKYINCDWDPGFRAWVKVNDIICGFNGGIIYTYFHTDKSASTDGDIDTIRLSTSLPFGNLAGDEAEAKWKLEYQTLDFILSRPLQLSCDDSFGLEAFSGLKYLKISQERHDEIIDNDLDISDFFHRDLDFWGIGPVMGIKSHYDVCGGFKFFGMASAALILGETREKDHFTREDTGEGEVDQHYKSNDDCFCFPGFHFLSGIAYEMCMCDTQLSLHIGWEYIHWINAPTFPFYQVNEFGGIRSASSEKNLTLQGIFAGVDIKF
jgi:hypothetical protein